MNTMALQAAAGLLMYGVLPVWLLAGFTDYLCHRASNIENTSGTQESLLHLLQFGSIAIPTILALLFEINAGFFLIAAIVILFHHGVAFIDVRYANRTRRVSPFEQMVHSFLEILPITAFLLLAVLHWSQLLALAGLGTDTANYGFHLKRPPLPVWYAASAIGAAILFNAVPYLEELARCAKHGTQGRE